MSAGWEERAACQALAPEFFYPAKGDVVQAQRAREVCKGCPVREACLAATLEDEKPLGLYDREGIRGGLDGRERYVAQHGPVKPRRRAPKKRPSRARALLPCGTAGAADRHVRRGEPLDAACAEVRAARTRSRRVPAVAERPECGTRSGFLWHTAHHEIPCNPCTAADLAVTWFIREGRIA